MTAFLMLSSALHLFFDSVGINRSFGVVFLNLVSKQLLGTRGDPADLHLDCCRNNTLFFESGIK